MLPSTIGSNSKIQSKFERIDGRNAVRTLRSLDRSRRLVVRDVQVGFEES